MGRKKNRKRTPGGSGAKNQSNGQASADKLACPYCDRSYASKDRLVHHSMQAHGKRPRDAKKMAIGIAIAVAVVVAGGLGVWARAQSFSPDTRDGNLNVFGISDDDPFMGSRDAPVIVVAFESPVCSGCKWFHENMLPSLERSYFSGTDVAFVYQHFDTYGQTGHRGLERVLSLSQDCVYREAGNDPFWAWTQFLYEQQFQVTGANVEPNLEAFAEAHGVDVAPIIECLRSGAPTDEVEEDINVGHRKGVRGTPSFFVFGPEGKATKVSTNELEATIAQAVAALP